MVLRDSVSDCLDALERFTGDQFEIELIPPASIMKSSSSSLLRPRPRRHKKPRFNGYVHKPEGEPRSNALPEGNEYHDEGCELAPACLSCPFPDCRFDLPRGFLTMRVSTNMERSQELRAQGLTVDSVAGQLGVSRRTVQRWSAVMKAGV